MWYVTPQVKSLVLFGPLMADAKINVAKMDAVVDV
jgi:hypothetical protein